MQPALIVLAVCLGTTPARSTIVVTGPGSHIGMLVVAPDGDTVTLTPDPVTYLADASAAMQARLAAEFPGFNFTFQTGGLAGTLHINRYEAGTRGPHQGGGILEATYTRNAADPPLGQLQFVQMINSNDPAGGTTSPYIDPRPNDDTQPFYYTSAEAADARTAAAGTFRFIDFSSRPCRNHPDHITWRGELILASANGRNVDVYDGIRWGWDFQCVPEPSSLVLVTIGAVGIVFRRIVRSRKV
jgi:hypothetical protein